MPFYVSCIPAHCVPNLQYRCAHHIVFIFTCEKHIALVFINFVKVFDLRLCNDICKFIVFLWLFLMLIFFGTFFGLILDFIWWLSIIQGFMLSNVLSFLVAFCMFCNDFFDLFGKLIYDAPMSWQKCELYQV